MRLSFACVVGLDLWLARLLVRVMVHYLPLSLDWQLLLSCRSFARVFPFFLPSLLVVALTTDLAM